MELILAFSIGALVGSYLIQRLMRFLLRKIFGIVGAPTVQMLAAFLTSMALFWLSSGFDEMLFAAPFYAVFLALWWIVERGRLFRLSITLQK